MPQFEDAAHHSHRRRSRAADLSGQVLSLEERVLVADTYMPKPKQRGPNKKKDCIAFRRVLGWQKRRGHGNEIIVANGEGTSRMLLV